MPNKKPVATTKLNKKDLEFFKKLLLQKKSEILHDIKNMSDNPRSEDADSRDLSGHVQHMADVATDMYDKEFAMGLASHDREVLQKIESALRRIEDGTYGICLGTGDAISKERLKAIPYAEYTLKYQESLENNKSR